MSMQQVNLYLPELRPKNEWLTLQTICVSALLYIAFMLVTLQIVSNDLANRQELLVSKENVLAGSQERLKKYRNMSKSVNVAQMDQEIADLKLQVNERQQISAIIEGQKLGNEYGFSANLESLARQSLPSISLSKIRISQGGKLLELRGETTSPADIALYIDLLQAETSFANSLFGNLSVSSANTRRQHDFAMGFESVYKVAMEGNKKWKGKKK